jgi:hypothetical protein
VGLGEPSTVRNMRNLVTFHILESHKSIVSCRLAYKRSCLYNKFRDAALYFKKDMMQLFWIMKEFSQSTKKILVAFAKIFHYPND